MKSGPNILYSAKAISTGKVSAMSARSMRIPPGANVGSSITRTRPSKHGTAHKTGMPSLAHGSGLKHKGPSITRTSSKQNSSTPNTSNRMLDNVSNNLF